MGPTNIDRYLAFHAPKQIGFDPKAPPKEAASFVIAAAGAAIIAFSTIVVHSFVVLAALFVVAILAILWIKSRQPASRVAKERTFMASLYHQVYGQYGWNEDAGPHRSTEPVPIRSADKLLSPEAFNLLEVAATQALRIHAQASSSDLARRAVPTVDRTMRQLFELAPGMTAGSQQPPEAVRDVSQLRELADHLSGVSNPAPALTENGISPLESLLLDARAEHGARLELNQGIQEPRLEQEQQQQ